jgi:SAM-dependent methyltransferase
MSESEQPQHAASEDGRRTRHLRLRVIIAAAIMVLMAWGVRSGIQYCTDPVDARFAPPPGGHVMYLPTPQDVVVRMLALAAISKDDLVYDLGCGDGRVLVTAAKIYGCRCRGFDIDPLRVRDSLQNARQHGVADLVQVEQRDIFTLDLSEADVVFLYLLPELNVKLIPQLRQLRPGTRIISHMFDMQGVSPDQVLHLDSSADNTDHAVYLWTAPLKSQPTGAHTSGRRAVTQVPWPGLLRIST